MRKAALLLFLGGAFIFSSCYSLGQGFTYLGLLGRAIPLERLEDSAGTAEEGRKNREFAALVSDIRRFAREELSLRETKNFGRYVALDRDWLALVVSASAADSFKSYEWSYPVVGRLPYRGFFREEDARKEAERLRDRGFDVWVRKVDAFSTLGWLRDPLWSWMRDYPVHRLADLLIHETVHATVFLKNRGAFNEEFAEFAGTEGARLYVLSRFGAESAEYRALTAEREDSAAFMESLGELRAALDALYGSGLPREEMLDRKAETIAAFQARFALEYESRFQSGAWRGFAAIPVNNAFLELYGIYHGDGFFRDLYGASGLGLGNFIAAAKKLRGKDDPKAELARLLAGDGAE